MKVKFIFIIFSLFSTVHAADLVFTPTIPVVEINKQIQLSVSGVMKRIIVFKKNKNATNNRFT
jgi:hypothetical protein